MTLVLAPTPAPEPAPVVASRKSLRRTARRRARLQQIGIIALAVVGIGVLVYPAASTWLNAKQQEGIVTGYIDEIASLPSAEVDQIMASAREYNAAIPDILLTDPYGTGEADAATSGGAVENYLTQLRVGELSTMARLSIPSIAVDLPIFHGTDDATLAAGVGHLFGSSLPVGGEGTHSVLTAHSGFVTSTLFDDLDQVKKGDIFTVTVLDEVLYYEVDDISVVLPTEVDQLRLEPGADYVTLVTCTPTGVNSHRLLVRGERVDPEDVDPQGTIVVPATTDVAGFPWWLPVAVVGIAAVLWFALASPRRRRRAEERRRAADIDGRALAATPRRAAIEGGTTGPTAPRE